MSGEHAVTAYDTACTKALQAVAYTGALLSRAPVVDRGRPRNSKVRAERQQTYTPRKEIYIPVLFSALGCRDVCPKQKYVGAIRVNPLPSTSTKFSQYAHGQSGFISIVSPVTQHAYSHVHVVAEHLHGNLGERIPHKLRAASQVHRRFRGASFVG